MADSKEKYQWDLESERSRYHMMMIIIIIYYQLLQKWIPANVKHSWIKYRKIILKNYSIIVYHAQNRNHFYYSHHTNESKKPTERLYSQFNSLTSGNAINNKPRFTLNSVSTKMRCVMHENVKTYPHKEMSISKRIERTDWSSDDVR